MSEPDFNKAIEALAKPNRLQEEKADLYQLAYGLTIVCFFLWVVPITWAIYHWAF